MRYYTTAPSVSADRLFPRLKNLYITSCIEKVPLYPGHSYKIPTFNTFMVQNKTKYLSNTNTMDKFDTEIEA